MGTKTFSQDISTPATPGVDIFGALLRDIFNVDQRVENGQYVLGAEPIVEIPGETFTINSEYKNLSKEEVRDILKPLGQWPDGPSNQGARKRLWHKYNDQERIKFNLAKQAFLLGPRPPREPLFGTVGGDIRSLFDKGLGTQGQALESLIKNQGNPVDVSALADARFTDLKEQFSGFGGLFGSDFQAAQGRNVLEFDVAAQEAARNRQLQALSLSQSFDPFSDYFGTPGGNALAFLRQLSTPQSTNPFSAGQNSFGFSSSNSDDVPRGFPSFGSFPTSNDFTTTDPNGIDISGSDTAVNIAPGIAPPSGGGDSFDTDLDSGFDEFSNFA